MKRVVSVFVPVMFFLKQGDRARRTQFSSILDLAVCSRVCPEASLVRVYLYQTFAHLEEHILRTIHGQCRGIDSLSTEPLRLEGAKFIEIENAWERLLGPLAVGTNEMKQLTSITETPANQNDALTGRKPATNASLREIESTTLVTVKGDWPRSPKDNKPRNYAGFVVVPAMPMMMHNKPTKLKIRKTKCHGSYSKVPKRVPIKGERMGSVKKTCTHDRIYLNARHHAPAWIDAATIQHESISYQACLRWSLQKRDWIYDCGLGIMILIMYMGRCSVWRCGQNGFTGAHRAKSFRERWNTRAGHLPA
jgi:hypothetical protein